MEGWPGVHKPFIPTPSTSLTFLISPWQQGAPILPAGSWALLAASVQLAFLPVCVLESACGGGLQVVVLVARENRRNLESAPRHSLRPVSTNLLPLPVELQNILDVNTGMGSSLQGSLHGPRESTGVVQMKACDDGHHATWVLLPCPLGQS